MTYAGNETSALGGKPVELYRFVRGARTWLYTTADVPITYLGDTYNPQMMHRGDLPQNEERDNATLDIFLDPRLDVVAEFISGVTARPTDVTLIRRHRPDAAGQHAVIFVGTVGVVTFSEVEVHFTCVPVQKSMARKVPRWLYQPQCNHMLYDQFCGINPAAFSFAGSIAGVAGRVLTVAAASAHPDGYFNGGWVKDGESFGFIQQHTGSSLQLLAYPGNGAFLIGDAVTLVAGCDRYAGTCASKFGNLPNFMGFPFMPGTNPFNGLM